MTTRTRATDAPCCVCGESPTPFFLVVPDPENPGVYTTGGDVCAKCAANAKKAPELELRTSAVKYVLNSAGVPLHTATTPGYSVSHEGTYIVVAYLNPPKGKVRLTTEAHREALATMQRVLEQARYRVAQDPGSPWPSLIVTV